MISEQLNSIMSKVIIFFFLIMVMGISMTFTEARQHQRDSNLISTSSSRFCMCRDLDISCRRSCKRCDCNDSNSYGMMLCQCNDVYRSCCPSYCKQCFCSDG
ncbi:hypothetical protein PIB30_047205 [Stylosanthes scabra]|uniref:Uncharacterized protein n=1 Tax=Stylosanthes scabra TaxID=79078 RepID=A0ABU6TIM8_9FABA|nr:hypothetical protein [Stylosanthes scabra]